jgi:hypothetical protein
LITAVVIVVSPVALLGAVLAYRSHAWSPQSKVAGSSTVFRKNLELPGKI